MFYCWYVSSYSYSPISSLSVGSKITLPSSVTTIGLFETFDQFRLLPLNPPYSPFTVDIVSPFEELADFKVSEILTLLGQS